MKPAHSALESSQSQARFHNPDMMRTSMGFQTFLQKTMLPDWFPLSNLETGQQQVLNILNLKKDNRGNLTWDDKAEDRSSVGELHGTIIPMQPRTVYRVCVVGGGIAGLSSCLEIFRRCEREQIRVEVVLVEGRSRLGGRLWTDRESFKRVDGTTPFAVDLGASWIHGIELNPLAALAREAGVDFVRTSEDVKMFTGGLQELDPEKDRLSGELFDKLLDIAVSVCVYPRNNGSNDVL
jgi:Flavin containing amine oxidoreductase